MWPFNRQIKELKSYNSFVQEERDAAKKELNTLREENDKLVAEVTRLKKDVGVLEETVTSLTNAINKAIEDSGVSVDFRAAPIFSIERIWHDDSYITVLGLNPRNGKFPEWFIYCSDETHARLVEEYNRYKAQTSLSEIVNKS